MWRWYGCLKMMFGNPVCPRKRIQLLMLLGVFNDISHVGKMNGFTKCAGPKYFNQIHRKSQWHAKNTQKIIKILPPNHRYITINSMTTNHNKSKSITKTSSLNPHNITQTLKQLRNITVKNRHGIHIASQLHHPSATSIHLDPRNARTSCAARSESICFLSWPRQAFGSAIMWV